MGICSTPWLEVPPAAASQRHLSPAMLAQEAHPDVAQRCDLHFSLGGFTGKKRQVPSASAVAQLASDSFRGHEASLLAFKGLVHIISRHRFMMCGLGSERGVFFVLPLSPGIHAIYS